MKYLSNYSNPKFPKMCTTMIYIQEHNFSEGRLYVICQAFNKKLSRALCRLLCSPIISSFK